MTKIKHMVVFCLKYDKLSHEANKFLRDGKEILSNIPGVDNFTVYNQISDKNGFDYGFSMDFENKEVYEAYNVSPAHVEFVDKRWKDEVTTFMEIDFKDYF